MRLCRVLGSVTATAKHPAFHGRTLLVVQPLDERGADAGDSFVAIDHAQAGPGDRVLVLTEGNGVRQILQLGDQVPIRSMVVGIVDAVDTEAAP
ncbi:MAG TPA: EutN/CcmL family microcompartment protein [Kofleriaceae bacterium]|jgi:ethanolamine utilization protein EutN|nr:EutN/CcmL family microcompartment protein [Kofleriaceae bacterium]